MKKKLYSIITAIMILFACVFASACGDKYKKMEFKVLYAYTQDAEEWFDGSNGISLNYGNDDLEEGEVPSSLVFNENGVATLYVKIEIENVKSKHIDSITVSFASFTGLNFSSKRVKENQVFEVPITGNVETTLKLYENNSGKKTELPFIISKELEKIEADLSIKPAIASNGVLSLLSLNNLSYYPLYQTNQIGVCYSVDSFGRYDNGIYVPNLTYSAESLADYAVVENGVLKILDGSFYESCYIVRIKATSLYHDGSENEEAIFTYFDVYVVESSISAPVVKFNDENQKDVKTVNIYENAEEYATSTVFVDKTDLMSSKYYTGVNTFDGVASYTIAIYVLNENNEYEKYEFDSAKHQSGINGLIVQDEGENKFKFSIVNRNVKTNKVKFVYEIDGLDCSFINITLNEKEIEIVKGVVPTYITVNDSLNLTGTYDEPGKQSAVIQGTTSESYKGLELKLSANPNDNSSRLIKLGNVENGLEIRDERGNLVDGQITTGNTIFIKFKTNVTVAQTLILKTLKVPTIYNGQDITSSVESDVNNNIVVKYELSKVITADAFEFLANKDVNGETVENVVVDAESGSSIYVKVYYTGVNLDTSSVSLSSDNDNVVFANGTTSMSLKDSGAEFKKTYADEKGKYDLYAVKIKASNGNYSSHITIAAGEGKVGVEKTVTVTSVYVMGKNALKNIDIQAQTSNVKEFGVDEVDNGASNFAIPKDEYTEFKIVDGDGGTKTIAGFKISNADYEEIDMFSKSAVTLKSISNSAFDAIGKVGSKTQILNIEISYYVNEDDIIVQKSINKEIQIAVYDGVGNIGTNVTKSMIGYVNAYYTEISSTEITFDSYRSNGGTPASSVTFKGEAENISVNDASQIQVTINSYTNVKASSAVDISFSSSNTQLDLLKDQSTILKENGTNFLDGKISVKLVTVPSGLEEISLSIKALRFGSTSNVITNVVIKIADVDKADRILVSGDDFVETGDNTNELQLSFMKVADGGYDEKSFNATIKFDSVATANSLRFTDINTALTHVLYEYTLNEDGTVASINRIQNDFFTITYSNGKVNVRAYKKWGGGLFKLVLATKDSYTNPKNPSEIIAEESDFTTKYELTIRVSDGAIGSEYIIKTEEELSLVNYNLSSHFVLGANISIISTDFKPLGLVGETLSPFKGSLSGQLTTIIENEQALVTTYSITMQISSSVASTEHGSLFGLFAILDESAEVKNLKLNVSFAESFANTLGNGAKIGAVAGVNNGTISNVSVSISSNKLGVISFNGVTAGQVDFGGIVGLNNNKILSSKVDCSSVLTISSNAKLKHNIGLIAGTNKDTISGLYNGKESLNNFIFDVVANLKVENYETSNNQEYNIGAVVGNNVGIIENLLVGGSIVVGKLGENGNGDSYQLGNLGGIVGLSTGGTIKTITALSLDLTSNSNNVNVGGVVGSMSGDTIDNVKFVSVATKFLSFTSAGVITGKNLVAGLVAKAENATIINSSVESFIETIDDEKYGTKGETFYTIKNGTTTAGLVASESGTNVENSFVNANISSVGDIKLLKEAYFIGKINGSISINNTIYSIINGVNIENFDATYMTSIEVDENTTDWTNVYLYDAANVDYIKVKSYDINQKDNYYKFDILKWVATAKTYVSLTWIDEEDENGNWLYSVTEDGNWKIQENYNVVSYKGINLFFPYLIESDETIMIVAPLEISANINQDYITEVKSVYVKEFDWTQYEHKITESVIVNYFNGAKDEENAHKLFSDKDKNNGLFDVSILPEDAQGGYVYEILGTGRNFAYINSSKQIVFTGVSGQNAILIRIYSAFNPDVVYVTIYTQSLLTNLKLTSNSIYYSNQEEYDYEINAYSGQSNIILTLDAENRINGYNYSSIFNVYNLSQYLIVGYTTDAGENSKLDINVDSMSNMTLRIQDGEIIEKGDIEIVTFTLYLKADYFDGKIGEGNELVPIEKVSLKVHLYNSAKSIQVEGEDAEITSADDISFDVALTTDYVDTEGYNNYLSTKIERAYVDSEGNIVLSGSDVHDSIKIALNVVEGIDEVERLLEENDLTHFAELFNLDTAVISSLNMPENETDKTKAIGYVYNVMLELKDDFNYRHLTKNIKFNVVIYARSNPEVNNEEDAIEILMKPTMVTTARIENYTVNSLNVNTDYTSIVSNEYIQTSIIEPGSLGNVMMIYLEPTYSNVTYASIKTSVLYVPSLGKNVKMKFTQLVLDYRKNNKGNFTTLYGADTTTQVGDTLELKLISEIDAQGNRIYNGVICVYIQLEEFSGLEATMTVELNVETSNGTTHKTITRSRELLTTYLPGTKLSYDEEKAIDDGYLIQKGTSANEVYIKIYGYQFNSNPDLTFEWNLQPKYDANGEIVKNDDGSIKYDGDYNYVGDNKRKITDGTKTYLIGDYVSYYLVNNYDELVYNSADNSYTLTLRLNVSEDIMASFSIGASLSLTTKDGQLQTSNADENKIIFYPTDYILDSAYINRLSNGRKNVAINKTSSLELMFTTDNENNDLTEEIYVELLEYAYGVTADYTKTIEERLNYILSLDSLARENAKNKLGSKLSYYKNGETITFADSELHPEFEFNLVNGETISILGISKFTNLVEFKVWYGYAKSANGIYTLNFGENGEDGITTSLTCEFTLNVYAVDEENEIAIYSADEIYNSTNGTWDLVEGVKYVLMNDIELENVVPITTPIAQLDGNNRVISIKSFAVDQEASEFGLFAHIGTYSIQDQETEQEIQKQTILKNVIVDYSKFDGTLAVNNNTSTNITFGGLVGTNNGGLIYNCDVVNLSASTDAQVDVIVNSTANVTFGGLVGTNSGIITNSRVGRDSYTRIVATKTTESSSTRRLGGLSFAIYNSENENDVINQFSIVAGGFVGSNSGTISTSYVANTNLTNYSTNETSNITAGFVGSNGGTISYSYAKADDDTITTSNPYATGYVIENTGNGIVSGFVYENNGTITNSYSNLELKTESAYISGFVYINNGTISESYAATTMNAGDTDNNAEQPFVGVDNAGNLLSNGTLENTYYLMRSDTDTPYKQGSKDVAQALNQDNFQNSEYLVGFAFVLSNVKADRDQGIWSYYTTESKKRVLPELMNANVVSHSYRYVVDDEALNKVFVSAISYAEGTANNPYTISSVDDYNKVFTEYGQSSSNQVGYIRFINNIDFNNEETAIKTRSNYTLGSDQLSTKTSVEGNGMTISGIYLDAGNVTVEKIGMFAEIKNAYVKNLNLQFATPTTNGQFSTTTAVYSGGLAGTIENSVILNISLIGNNTTLTGSNFVGGVAGLISGQSLIYGIETNLNVKASATESYLYYNEADYKALNIQLKTNLSYSKTSTTDQSRNYYINKLSYAGGVAGVLDLTKRANVEYNVQFINIRGDQMVEKTFDGKKEANMFAEYVGGVAGYASKETSSFRLKYYTGTSESLRGNTAVGGLYGVYLGSILASQVTAEEDTQYNYDTSIGEYIIELETNTDATLDTANAGNLNLLEGYKYVGGLVGVGLNTTIRASYSKVGITSGEIVGGLVGVSVASIVNYSYAIPYINSYGKYSKVGGLFGSVYGVASRTPSRNSAIAEFDALLNYKGVRNQNTDVQFTYSTIVLDKANFATTEDAVVDWIAADYKDKDGSTIYLQSNSNTNLTYVYAGVVESYSDIVQNQTLNTSKSSIVELYRLFNVSDPDQIIAFQEVFSGWSIMKYWSLNEEKYFPLLINETVDNFIEIDSFEDLDLIRNNPTGKFKIVNDIPVPAIEDNWVIGGSTPFQGVIIGEIEGESRRPKIIIQGLTPNTPDETSGFFKQTKNATINNIEIVWETSIDMSQVENLTMVSGLSCDDEGSLISNVVVRADNNEESKGYFINSDKPISGFGGIVGDSKNTNVLGCGFIGKIDSILLSKNSTSSLGSDGAYFGGIVAKAESIESSLIGDKNNKTEDTSSAAVINGSSVGADKAESNDDKYPITEFNVTIAEENSATVYIGGIVGYANQVAIASNNIGGTDHSDKYKIVNMNVTFEGLSNYTYVGGTVGYATDGLISNCNVITKITTIGTTDMAESQHINIAGLAGKYSMATETSLTSGISGCNVNTTIETFTDSDILKTGSDNVRISTGVAELVAATMKQCLFAGEIDTEGSDIQNLYAGGAVALAEANGTVNLEEIITDTILNVGSRPESDSENIIGTSSLYVGGLIGHSGSANISYSASWGRIIPITNSTASDIYVGGLIGRMISEEQGKTATINNSYTISSIVADSIAANAIQNLDIGALIGDVSNVEVTTISVYYSSDYALFADENYDKYGDPLGTNLSAQTMVYGSSWHKALRTEDGAINEIWKSLSVSSGTRIPHLSALEDALKQFDIISSETKDFAQGSAMRPEQIISGIGKSYSFDQDVVDDNGHFMQEKYKYYILIASTDNTLPTFNGALYGILIGQDLTYDTTFTFGKISQVESENDKLGIDDYYSGIIPAVLKHSVISNLHVRIPETTLTQDDLPSKSGIIAGLNNGVIFNSSVQGTGIEITETSIGLISYVNRGLISFSYSTAEIVSSAGQIGGIVHTNGGKLLSNYFTGYINAGNSSAAGIIFSFDEDLDNFVYNNYMAGVIVKTTSGDGNNFSAKQLKNEENGAYGANNFIDYYSDITYAENGGKINDIIKSVSTSFLMSGEVGLKGSWYFTVESGKFKDFTITDGERTNNPTFGTNYNYPVYRFNKLMQTSTEDLKVDDWKNQLDTGTGEVYKDEDPSLDNEKEITLEERYSVLVNKNANSESSLNYKQAFKIPHLGVLSSVQALLNNDFNYVVIYDLNGGYFVDGTEKETASLWEAIGTKDDDGVNGFNYFAGFNGVFVTNKYYSQTASSDENAQCLITNLNKNGLFANITNAYIGEIKLGSFDGLKESGALGTKILKVGEDKLGVTINNVSFVKDSIITGLDEANNFYGGLFGLVDDGGELIIKNFSSSHGTDTSTSASVKLTSTNANVGLIAGKSSGTIELKATKKETSTEGETKEEIISSYIAWFDGNNYAGGLVGEMAGGQILGNGNTIHISKSLNGDESVIKMLGGVAGKVSAYSNIKEINVSLYDPTGKVVTVLADSFGGAVGEVISEVVLNTFTLEIKGTEIQFNYGENKKANRYYGLIAAKQEAKIDVTTFTLSTKGDSTSPFHMTMVGEKENRDYTESNTNTGVGAFVGSQNGDLIVSGYSAPQVLLTARGVPNLGGVSGYYTSGAVALSLASEQPTEPLFILVGTTNVGGLFGWCNTEITDNNFGYTEEQDSALINLLSGSYGYSLVIVDGAKDSEEAHSNFGGLFGKWSASTTTGETTSNPEIVNNNRILIGFTEATYKQEESKIVATVSSNLGYALNIGGIAGKMTVSTAQNLKNQATIEPYSEEVCDESIVLSGPSDVGVSLCKAQNVGGVFGYLEPTSDCEVTNISNTANIYGHQNVGGLIGYVGNETKVNIKNGNAIMLDDGSNLAYDLTSSKITGATLNEKKALTGNITGVINVGGAVGYAGQNVTISQIYSKANVSGNANVGGLVGFVENATLMNNYIQGGTAFGVVKGVYYKYISLAEDPIFYIPTSVGGLTGAMVSNGTSSSVAYNIIDGVQISSAEEGGVETNPTISTIENYMVSFDIGSGNSLAQLNNPTKLYPLSFEKSSFGDIKTGFGGFAGTINSNAVSICSNNYMNNIDIKAQLGINVGTYYGAYKYDLLVSENDANPILTTPQLSSTNETLVDGAYNVGGIVGFINGGKKTFNLSNSNLTGGTTIKLQTRMTGLYIGGLIGKTNSNTISGLNITTGNSISIGIDTSISYYVGGLIGRAEVNETDATISGDSITGIVIKGSDVKNYGGLIGMLKIGDSDAGLSVEVKGTHENAFTVNVVENSSYAEGDTDFNYDDETNNEVSLFAEAYYVNQDQITIVGSSETFTSNPLNTNAQGWSKQYTGFSKIQKRIPETDNNGAKWDAILTLYDASQITHVGTIENLGLEDDDTSGSIDGKSWKSIQLPANSATWEHTVQTAREAGILGENANDSITEIPSPSEFEKNFANDTEGFENAKTVYYDLLYMYSFDGTNGVFNDDYICFTVYNEGGNEKLYSAMGIASAVYNSNEVSNFDEDNPNDVYETITDLRAPLWQWVGGVLSNTEPYQKRYIDANNKDNNLLGLTYFNWGTSRVKAGESSTNGWKSYTTIGGYQSYMNVELGVIEIDWKLWAEGDITSYQYELNAEDSGIAKFISYFIPNYLSGEGDANYKGQNTALKSSTGAFFVFDAVYDNESLNNLESKDEEDKTKKPISYNSAYDSNCCYSGSIFDSAGMHTEEADAVLKNTGKTNWFAIVTFVGALVVDVAITVATFGAGGVWVAAKGAAKNMGKQALKVFIRKAATTIISNIKANLTTTFIKQHWKRLGRAYIASIVVALSITAYASTIQATENFVAPSKYNYGYLSSVYSREITYIKDAKTKNISPKQVSDDMHVTDNGTTYVYFSATRPYDYHTHTYVGMKLHGSLSGDTFTMDTIDSADDLSKYSDKSWQGFLTEDDILTVKLENGDNVANNCSIAKFDDGYYLIEKKYEIVDGKYYINTICGDISSYRVTLGFDGSGKRKTDYIEEDNVYVHGAFDGTNYYYDNKYPGNNLSYDGTDYDFNGVKITSDIAEKVSSTPLNYERGGVVLDGYVLGYDYFTTAYYTVQGKSSIGANAKYATFEKYNGSIQSGWIENVHYVRRKYSSYIEDNTYGIYKFVDGKYVLAEDEYSGTRYSITNEILTYVLQDNQTFGEGEGLDDSYALTSEKQTITVTVYPSTFINPYSNFNIDNCDDNTNYVYTDKNTTNVISHRPTYFIYEGGYLADTDGVDEENGMAVIFLPVNADMLQSQMKVDGTTTTLENIQREWAKNEEYGNKTLTDYECSVSDMFVYKDGVLYMIDTNYTLGEDGLLHKIIMTMESEYADKSLSMFENMYLSNEDFNFYTRYRYYSDGNYSSLTNIGGWGGYNVIPSSENSTTINGGKTTKFVESARVILNPSGKEIALYNTKNGVETRNISGFIKVK